MTVSPDEEISTRTLVLMMVGPDGTLDAGPLYDIAATCGMNDQQVRLCLRRLVLDGTLEHVDGRGRRAVFRRTDPSSEFPLAELALVQFAYDQDAGKEPWDGWWRLVSFSLDQARRGVRDELRATLLFLGGAPLQSGLYVSANDWDELVAEEVRRLDVTPDVLTLTTRRLDLGGEDDPRTIAARVWPLETVRKNYLTVQEIVGRRLEVVLGAARPDTTAMVRAAVLTVVDFSRVMGSDPLLPPELLPEDWPGPSARRLVSRSLDEFDARLGDALPPLLKRLAGIVS